MPRPNPPRAIGGERDLARRIGHERESRGMTYEGLAALMTKAGCPIQPSAIYKIEKAEPPRRITVDELVAFAEVFAVPVQNLLLPPELAARDDLVQLIAAWDNGRRAVAAAQEEERAAWAGLEAFAAGHPEMAETLEAAMRAWAAFYFERDEQDFAVNYWMHQLTHDRAWGELAKAELDARIEAERD